MLCMRGWEIPAQQQAWYDEESADPEAFISASVLQCACLNNAVCSFHSVGNGSSLPPRALTQIHLQHAF